MSQRISRAYRVPTTAVKSVNCTYIGQGQNNIPAGTIMTMRRTMIPTIKHMRIFMSFHHICFRTLFAPLRKPWAETARLSVLSRRESSRSPLCDTLLMFSRITPTVSSICCKRSHVSCSSNKSRDGGGGDAMGSEESSCGGRSKVTVKTFRQHWGCSV